MNTPRLLYYYIDYTKIDLFLPSLGIDVYGRREREGQYYNCN